jgi:hypothetical protein
MIAIAVAVLALTWSHGTQSTQATAGTPTMSFRVSAGSLDCSPTAKPAKCSVAAGSQFKLDLAVNEWPTGGYTSLAYDVDWTGTALTKKPPDCSASAAEGVWPDKQGLNSCAPATVGSTTHFQGGDLSSGFGATPSTFKGNVFEYTMNCGTNPTVPSSNVVNLIPWDPTTNPLGAGMSDPAATIFPTSDSITINCVVANTPTPTNTPTNTPTPTDTPTTVPIPRMQKCTLDTAISTDCNNEANLFLTRQGTKIPPFTCDAGTDGTTLVERIHIPIDNLDPKDPSQLQELGGFSFQVKFDPLKVCVDLAPGPSWQVNPQQICTVDGSVQGVARISCVTLGKATVIDTHDPVNRILATITVKPQPEEYSQIKPNQDNGNAVQINNEACKLTDLQGHAIPTFSCEDADLTIRFLEGDVEPDCDVNTLDTQAIAFRWGAQKGSLVYLDRFNLEPSGTQADQDIDVNDLQFVYGRFGSNCAAPWPAQEPINPKA